MCKKDKTQQPPPDLDDEQIKGLIGIALAPLREQMTKLQGRNDRVISRLARRI